MRRLALTAAVFALAVAVNTGSVAAQQRGAHLTRRFGRCVWEAHLALIAPAWLAFLALLPRAGRGVCWRLPTWARPVGWAMLAAATALWALAYRRLGFVRMANGDLFGRAAPLRLEDGVFACLRDPMYDSYGLALAGAGLASGNPAYLALAAESVLLLNGLEARVERAALPDAERVQA